MSWNISPWVYPVWDCLGFLDLDEYFLSHIREVFDYNCLDYFLTYFLFHIFFWCGYSLNVGLLNIVAGLRLSSFVFILFLFFFFFKIDKVYSGRRHNSLECGHLRRQEKHQDLGLSVFIGVGNLLWLALVISSTLFQFIYPFFCLSYSVIDSFQSIFNFSFYDCYIWLTSVLLDELNIWWETAKTVIRGKFTAIQSYYM